MKYNSETDDIQNPGMKAHLTKRFQKFSTLMFNFDTEFRIEILKQIAAQITETQTMENYVN